MNIAILGAAGRTGQHLVQLALEAGHEVTGLVREEKNELPTNNPKLTIVVGDATNKEDLIAVTKNCSAVLSVLGSNKLNDPLIVKSTTALLNASKETGVGRIIMLSSFLVSPRFKQNFISKIAAGLLKNMVNDKSSGEKLLMNSPSTWTIIYATTLDRAQPNMPVRVIAEPDFVTIKNGISRQDVAQFMLDSITDTSRYKKQLVITTK
jgi:uncharacterized protein YbjT (DUF2867 family)